MRPTTKKGRIGKRRVFLNESEILKESPDGRIYRVPVYGSALVAGHWYADTLYSIKKVNQLGLTEADRWKHPVFIHFVGYGTVVNEEGEEVLVSLFNEVVNDAGIRYRRVVFRGGLYSIVGIDELTPLFQPTPLEVGKVKRRASEKRHGWSK